MKKFIKELKRLILRQEVKDALGIILLYGIIILGIILVNARLG